MSARDKIYKLMSNIDTEIANLQDKIDDAEYSLENWGFSYKPSEIRKKKDQIKLYKRELDFLERIRHERNYGG